jgi:hypothetical protein
MRALLFLSPVLALLAGCVSRWDTWTTYPLNPGLKIVNGSITNNTGKDLHSVKIVGRFWMGNDALFIQPAYKRELWPAGSRITMHYKWSSIDSMRLTLYSKEGKWLIRWPLDPANPE